MCNLVICFVQFVIIFIQVDIWVIVPILICYLTTKWLRFHFRLHLCVVILNLKSFILGNCPLSLVQLTITCQVEERISFKILLHLWIGNFSNSRTISNWKKISSIFSLLVHLLTGSKLSSWCSFNWKFQLSFFHIYVCLN